MTFSAALGRTVLLLLASLALGGCVDSTQSQMDEEKESHFLLGKSRVSAMDYDAAIECFEKALEVNPKSAAAHFEMACLFEKREMDPAGGIYHYQQYLKLRPKAENTEIVNQHILSLKQELAKTVSLGPVTERQQKDFEHLLEENKRLSDEVERWRASAARLQAPTNPVSGAPPSARAVERSSESRASSAVTPALATVGGTAAPGSSATGTRSHTVKAGETPTIIARKYGVKLEALMSANPGLDPRRMRVGQTLKIPAARF